MKTASFLLALALTCGAATSALGYLQGPEKIKATRTITGKVVGFEVGDYVHAIVKDTKGQETSYYLGGGPSVDCFLTSHLNKNLTLTIQTVDAYLESAGGRETFDRIGNAKLGKLTAASWWMAQTKKTSKDKLISMSQKFIEKLNRAGRSLRFETPVLVALNEWVFGVKSGGKWKEPDQSLHQTDASLVGYLGTKVTVPSWHSEVLWNEEGPLPILTLRTVNGDAKKTLYVSGGKAKFAKITRIGGTSAVYGKIARDYAASKGRGKVGAMVEDGVQADVNGDGTLDVILAINSMKASATESSKRKDDYCALILRSVVGGKLKTMELTFESGYGLQRGPFHAQVLAVADLDGDGKHEIVVRRNDPWGEEVSIFQLSKAGKLSKLYSAGIGE